MFPVRRFCMSLSSVVKSRLIDVWALSIRSARSSSRTSFRCWIYRMKAEEEEEEEEEEEGEEEEEEEEDGRKVGEK